MSSPISLAHRLWRQLPVAPRRHALAAAATILAPRPDRLLPPVAEGAVIGGEIHRGSGLGEGARIMGRALHSRGIPQDQIEAGLVSGRLQGASSCDRGALKAPLILHVNAPEFPAALFRLGRRFLKDRRIVGYWAWELPIPSSLWSYGARFVHEVWVPSRFTAQALEGLVPGRIRVVPHALALSPVIPAHMDRQSFGLPENTLIVLVSFSLASGMERKNPIAAIRAFRAAFGQRTDRMLVLKLTNAEHYPDEMRRIQAEAAGADNIRFETRFLPAEESAALMQASDVVLSLHRSEGFGLVPAEAMLMGKTVISTDWSATAEFLNDECGLPVSYRLIPARDPRGVYEAPGAFWADVDLHSAVSALRRAEDPDLRKKMGAAAQLRAGQCFHGDELFSALTALREAPLS